MSTFKFTSRLILKINAEDYNETIARKILARAISNNASIKLRINECDFTNHCTKYTCLFDTMLFIEKAIAPAKPNQIIKFYIFKHVKQD